MIRELVELAERIRKDEPDKMFVHDALSKERIDAYIHIDSDGSFLGIMPIEKKETYAEDLVRTENKGRTSNVLPRLILDNEKYVLGIPKTVRNDQCHKEYLGKLHRHEDVACVRPILDFFEKKDGAGLKSARKVYQSKVESKEMKPGTNFSFLIRDKGGQDIIAHLDLTLIGKVKKKYEDQEVRLKGSNTERCSCCGSSSYRVRGIATHGTINGVLPRNALGNYLVSYEGGAFSSYGLEGNDNALICTHCAKGYVDGLNWLLAPRSWKRGTKKGKDVPDYKNRRDISEDTVVVFWLRDALEASELDLLDEPDEGKIRQMFRAIESGRASAARNINTDEFYAITLSGSAARIAVRDWIETSVEKLHADISHWFLDVEIGRYDVDEKKIIRDFPRFWELVRAVKSKGGKDVLHGRIGSALWKCAVLGASPPLWVLSSILSRIRAEQGNTTAERIALLKLILNRNQKGGLKFMAELDASNRDTAYTCGRIFAVLESIQYHASGGNLNAGLRERFFSFASTMPATAFGRLMKLAQHHLSKISGEKPGLAVNLDKKLQELISRIEGARFPAVFSLEEQASFAIGYYHQRQNDFNNKSDKEN